MKQSSQNPFMINGTPDKVYINGKETPEGNKLKYLQLLQNNTSEVMSFTVTQINGKTKLYVKTIHKVIVDNEIAQKAKFVNAYIKPMLLALNIGITNAEYVYDNAKGEEYVIISKGLQKILRCVTADSLKSLVSDVVKGLWGGGYDKWKFNHKPSQMVLFKQVFVGYWWVY